MKVWLVVTNDSRNELVSDLVCHGVYSSYEKAVDEFRKVYRHQPGDDIHAIELDEESNVYLGGYVG